MKQIMMMMRRKRCRRRRDMNALNQKLRSHNYYKFIVTTSKEMQNQ